MSDDDTIFLPVASYRDTELLPTIRDCVKRAARPEKLRFGVCVQAAAGEPCDLGEFSGDERFRWEGHLASESLGVGWARARAQSHYRKEVFVLQIDAHTRFYDGWDREIIGMWRNLDDPRAILSGYPGSYVPDETTGDVRREARPGGIACGGRNASGVPVLRPTSLHGSTLRKGAVPGMFVSAGLLFAPGCFVAEVGYDPEIYFEGEEVTLSARAFTEGFNVYHPHRTLFWHYYGREGCPRPWEDRESAAGWKGLEAASVRRVGEILSGDERAYGDKGLGRKRPLAEFLHAAGLVAKELPDSGRARVQPTLPAVPHGAPAPLPVPKLAFLFLTRGNHHQPAIWADYLAQGGGRCSVFGHAADPGSLGRLGFLGKAQIPERFHTRWGHISLVEATLALLANAHADPSNERFVLLSESCVPVVPFDTAYHRYFSAARCVTTFLDIGEIERRRPDILERFAHVSGIGRQHWYFHSQWMMLTRDAVTLLLDHPVVRNFRCGFAPDESYFLTALSRAGAEIRDLFSNRQATWVKWSEREAWHPREYGRLATNEIQEISMSGSEYARKFGPGSDIGNYGLHRTREAEMQAP